MKAMEKQMSSQQRRYEEQQYIDIHLPLLNQQTQMVIDFLSDDNDLIRVNGKGVQRQTALHIAAESNNFEAFKFMLEWIQSAFEDSNY
ncbi:hypothetical protein Gotur_025060 [Gossypium turneri]